MTILETHNLRHTFGGLVALDGVSFRVQPGRIKAIIGPNGAGKTTLFNIIAGVYRPTGGSVRFRGADITGRSPDAVCRMGISRTFQNLRVFGRMTVLENVMLARHAHGRAGFTACALRLPRCRREERAAREHARQRLADLGLDPLADEPVHSLSFGQRRMVELARALAVEPTLLLLDEPASGLNTRESADLASRIRAICDGGVTVLLVEHDMTLVMDLADEVLALHHGKPLAEGPPSAVRNHPEVVSVYLGGDFDLATSAQSALRLRQP